MNREQARMIDQQLRAIARRLGEAVARGELTQAQASAQFAAEMARLIPDR